MKKRKLIQCATKVKKDAVCRKTINGIEHVVVSSYTLPDDVVMNGGFYPADEIARSYQGLERTLAPVEHPTNSDGQFISASDPEAIHNFYAGAYNTNVSRSDGRVHIEKRINVVEAMKTDRGKRLLDRIAELEESDSPRPIHTSVGVFLMVEELEKPMTNAVGDEYSWIAREMVFDHDAILLDSIGAATPEKGVGMAVNADGSKVDVESIEIDEPEPKAPDVFEQLMGQAANSLHLLFRLKANADGTSLNAVMEQLNKAIQETVGVEWMYVVDLVGDMVVFETNVGFFEVPYRVDNGIASIVGIPIRVERNVTYTRKSNSEVNAMRELMLNALREAGVTVADDVGDAELLAKYNEQQASQNEPTESEAITQAVTNAVKPLSDRIDAMQSQLTANVDKELDELSELIGNSDKYPGIDKDAAKKLGIETLKGMAANCATAHGVPLHTNAGGTDDSRLRGPADMPK